MRWKILLTGRNGQVGAELEPLLAKIGSVVATDREQLDLASPDRIRTVVRDVRPQLIVNAAAYTDVGRAEGDEQNAEAINAHAPALMAEEGRKIGAAMIHYSTDYIFDGTKNSPYIEDDLPNPLNVYGKTKLHGEQAIRETGIPHLIFRTSWIYGTRGRNFMLAILRMATQRKELTVVRDQVGAPTWSRAIAQATIAILARVAQEDDKPFSKASGTYHMSAAGQTSWFDFATAILEQASHGSEHRPWFAAATANLPLIAERITPVTSDLYPTPVRRPAYSVLSNTRLKEIFSIELKPWRDQLNATFADANIGEHLFVRAEQEHK